MSKVLYLMHLNHVSDTDDIFTGEFYDLDISNITFGGSPSAMYYMGVRVSQIYTINDVRRSKGLHPLSKDGYIASMYSSTDLNAVLGGLEFLGNV